MFLDAVAVISGINWFRVRCSAKTSPSNLHKTIRIDIKAAISVPVVGTRNDSSQVKLRVAVEVGSQFGCKSNSVPVFQWACCQTAAAATEIVGVTTAHTDIQLEIWKKR